MTACLLILEYVSHELGYDQFHQKSDDIYRVVNDRYQEGERVQLGTITYPTIGKNMQQDFPEIINHTRLSYGGSQIIRRGDQAFRVDRGLYTDNQFLQLFDFELLAGSRTDLFKEPNEVVLTESTAQNIFQGVEGDWDAIIGEEVRLNRLAVAVTVAGVIADFPSNSLLYGDLLISYPTLVSNFGEFYEDSYTFSDFYHYVELKPGTDVAALELKFAGFSDQYFRGEEVSGAEEKFYLQPLQEAHLYSKNLEYEIGKTNDGTTVWALLLIAFFILVIAWINYINLSSVRAIERSKEVGVRAVMGAKGRQLIGQFMAEASVINGISFLLAIGILWQIQPLYNTWFDFELSFRDLFGTATTQVYLWLGIFVLFGSGILLSGFYPAWLLSQQQIPLVLKGEFQQSANSRNMRKGLVVFQFAVSIVLISGTWMVYQQVSLMNEKDLGILTDQIITIGGPELTPFDSAFIPKMQTLKDELAAHPGIESSTLSSRVPSQGMGRMFNVRRFGQPAAESKTSNFINIDWNFSNTYQLPLLAGKNFEIGDHNLNGNLVNKLVLNASAITMLGFEDMEGAIGQQITIGERNWTIKGIVADHHQTSLRFEKEAIIYFPFYQTNGLISIRTANSDIKSSLAHAEQVFQTLFPGNVFEYQFLDERVQTAYIQDVQFGRLLTFFTILALAIASLGLFGLASYTTHLRIKEISIRKVLGANLSDLMLLLSKDFIRLIIIAIIIGTPIAWYFGNLWLENFVYHINMPWWTFLLSGLAAIAVALAITGSQAIKAGVHNPVDALRR